MCPPLETWVSGASGKHFGCPFGVFRGGVRGSRVALQQNGLLQCIRRRTNPRPPMAVAALQQWLMEQPSVGENRARKSGVLLIPGSGMTQKIPTRGSGAVPTSGTTGVGWGLLLSSRKRSGGGDSRRYCDRAEAEPGRTRSAGCRGAQKVLKGARY
jgi:hypothetical protein